MTRFACLFAAAAILAAGPAAAQSFQIPVKPIPAPAEPGAIALWPGVAPGSEHATQKEQWDIVFDLRSVRNVTRPTLTPFLPAKGKATGAAVIVAPGGAFLSLSMDNEGWPVAQWLADHGVAAFVLKYRLDETPADDQAFIAVVGERMGAAMRAGAGHAPPAYQPLAIDDAQQAIRMVRARAAEWGVDPKRVGLIGFSAGAMTALETSLRNAPDARPDFVGLIYGPMSARDVPTGAPPLFAAMASNDGLFAHDDYGLLSAWRKAGGDIEMHLYQGGDHGFGSRKIGTTSDMWPEEFYAWMRSEGLLVAGGKAVTGKMF